MQMLTVQFEQNPTEKCGTSRDESNLLFELRQEQGSTRE